MHFQGEFDTCAGAVSLLLRTLNDVTFASLQACTKMERATSNNPT